MPEQDDAERPLLPDALRCRALTEGGDGPRCRRRRTSELDCPLGCCAAHCEERHWNCEACGEHRTSRNNRPCGSCNCCFSCCHCYNCSSCGRRYDGEDSPSCSACGMCENCCSCSFCEGCNERVTSALCQHDQCPDCCDCSDDDNGYREQDGDSPGAPRYANSPKYRKGFNSKRLAGVEYEYNRSERSAPVTQWVNKWSGARHSDGSCGLELVTAPIAGDHIRGCLSDLVAALGAANAVIDQRCGLHVHVDARDYRWDDVYRFIKVYALLEPLLYLIGGQARASNTYCSPNGAKLLKALGSSDRKDAVLQCFVCGRAGQKRKPGKKNGERYVGLNLMPWITGRHGGEIKRDATFEFRLHRHADLRLGAEHVINWVELLITIVDWTAGASEADVAALPRSALRALCFIAPRQKQFVLDRIKAWRKATSKVKNRPRTIDHIRCGIPRNMTPIPAIGWRFWNSGFNVDGHVVPAFGMQAQADGSSAV